MCSINQNVLKVVSSLHQDAEDCVLIRESIGISFQALSTKSFHRLFGKGKTITHARKSSTTDLQRSPFLSSPHTHSLSVIVVVRLMKLGLQLDRNSLYSPNLATMDYKLFLRMKQLMTEKGFYSNNCETKRVLCGVGLIILFRRDK